MNSLKLIISRVLQKLEKFLAKKYNSKAQWHRYYYFYGWVEDGLPVEYFLGMVPLTRTNAANIHSNF